MAQVSGGYFPTARERTYYPTTRAARAYYPTARENRAKGAKLMEKGYAQGRNRMVGRGRYTAGERQGQLCVVKWLRSGHVTSAHVFDDDIRTVYKALQIIDSFNNAVVISQTIRINVPAVWDFGSCKVLIEPYIEGFVKWNSNTGWTNGYDDWTKVMGALSHYSYHITKGQLVLCDLQGGFYKNCAVLTDPVINSRNREYGATDLGISGINSFFANHVCSEFCRGSWRMPRSPTTILPPIRSTTMRYAKQKW